MAHPLRILVETRANGRCEYCRRYQEILGSTFFEVEHCLPLSAGGLTIPSNLAFACRRCNLLKSNVVSAFDRRTMRFVPIFHPRQYQWQEHFRRSRDQLRIYGRTAIGRVTVERLQLNDQSECRSRKIQRDFLSAVFPLD